ncbi:DUF6493 family protein [Streptomyces sp. NPDC002490]|uniref:DUF6493 family protein n=1 Tax=Streptomyces sp. NPDC002490 TaxID=3154416 RepID=UPI0033218157
MTNTTATAGTAVRTGATGSAPGTPQDLVAAVRTGKTAVVVALVRDMDAAERRAALPALKELRKELRGARWNDPARAAYPALHAAGAGCQSGAAATATWLAGADMRWSGAKSRHLLDLLSDRTPEWQAEVARRLADRPLVSRIPYELMSGLVQRAGCEPPTTEAYVRGWMEHLSRSGGSRGPKFQDRLAADPHLVRMVAALFAQDDVGWQLEWTYGNDADHGWTPALTELTAAGVLDRATMVAACVARLLRGGKPHDQRAFLGVLTSLSPTREEERERIADWTALLADAVGPVAAHAQKVLGRLALDGQLTARQVAEASRGALFRPEKKLVRAQLVLLGKVLTASPGAASELLPAVADAFGHPDTDVQERAVKLLEKHARRADEGVRADLLGVAEQLSTVLRPRAAAALGFAPAALEPLDAGPHEEYLPPVPEPVRLAPPIGSVAELAEEVSALVSGREEVAVFERVLDGLVRHAHADRAALVEAVRPVVARRWWYPGKHPHLTPDKRFATSTFGIDVVLAALFDAVGTDTLHRATQRNGAGEERECPHSWLNRPRRARLWEAAHLVRTDPPPFLLATPTWTSGLLAAEDLVARLAEYRDRGVRPAEADFAQALLRVERDGGARAAAASALGTPEGERLARWLTTEEAAPEVTLTAPLRDPHYLLVNVGGIPGSQEEWPEVFRGLGLPAFHGRRPWSCDHWSAAGEAHRLAALPGRREMVAARIVDQVSHVATVDARGDVAYLPLLAEAPGPAGVAVHLSVAYGLGARAGEDRTAAVDALLVLAARGDLDAARLGGLLGTLAAGGTVKASRLVDSMSTAATTGAYATVWAVLREALPPLLEDAVRSGKGARGLADLLATAADCVERCGAGSGVPHLESLAERGGGSRLVSQARRLKALTGADADG